MTVRPSSLDAATAASVSPAQALNVLPRDRISAALWCVSNLRLICEDTIRPSAFAPNSQPYTVGGTPKNSMNVDGDPAM